MATNTAMPATTDDTLVTIVIPCYNSADYITGTIESLEAQTHQNLQILCINDGSKDATRQVIDALASADTRIDLVNKENGGIESALKYSLDHIRGAYTFLLGHDDTLSPDAIEKCLDAFKSNPQIDAVRPDLHFVHKDPANTATMCDRRLLTGTEAFLDTIGAWTIHTFCLWRSEIFRKIKEVDTNGNFNFDELATRYLYLSCRLVGYCTGVYYYLQHPESVSKKKSVKRLQILTTDILIRKLLQDRGLYSSAALRFEHYAALNLMGMIDLYHSMSGLSADQKKTALGYLRQGYSHLDKTIILPLIAGNKPYLWRNILASFKRLMLYTKIKSLYKPATA